MNSLYIIIAWLLIWGGYGTAYLSDNPTKTDKFRSTLPLLTGIISLFLLKEFSASPLTLMLGYTIVGIIGAFFCKQLKRVSWWWMGMFASPLLFLMVIDPQYIPAIMSINWVVASFASIFFVAYFFFHPQVFKKLKDIKSFFLTNKRPFEGWLGFPLEKNMFGLFCGTRPTGLGRYSAVASLVILCLFLTYNTWYYFLGFIFFTLILLFSKGKTEIGSFDVSMGFLLLITRNLLSPLMLMYILIVILSYKIIFNNPAKKSLKERIEYNKPIIFRPNSKIKTIADMDKKFLTSMATLGGRVGGAWKDATYYIKRKPLFGYGFNSERYLIKGYDGNPASVDGTIFNMLIQSGIIGTALFLTSLVWTALIGYNLIVAGNLSLLVLQSLSVGLFILIRGTMQSFSIYCADWIFLVPLIAYLQ